MDKFEVKQLKERVQYDGFNCGIYCLKVSSVKLAIYK